MDNKVVRKVGIIYKFTIIAKYKFYGHKPFYVGQHVGEDDFDSYDGSGKIWEDFIKGLKRQYPTCWRNLVKREVLYKHNCSQKVLDAMEAYYIKKEKAHYSYHLGGCNILWGTANKFGSGSPAKDKIVRKKMRENHADFNGKNNPFYGRHHTKETKLKISKCNSGENNKWYKVGFFHRKHTEESKDKMRKSLYGRYFGVDNPFYGHTHSLLVRQRIRQSQTGRIWVNNGYKEKRVKQGFILENDWHYGRLKKKTV